MNAGRSSMARFAAPGNFVVPCRVGDHHEERVEGIARKPNPTTTIVDAEPGRVARGKKSPAFRGPAIFPVPSMWRGADFECRCDGQGSGRHQRAVDSRTEPGTRNDLPAAPRARRGSILYCDWPVISGCVIIRAPGGVEPRFPLARLRRICSRCRNFSACRSRRFRTGMRPS